MVNIFLFVPNLIGYARVALLVASLYFMVRERGARRRERQPGAVVAASLLPFLRREIEPVMKSHNPRHTHSHVRTCARVDA